MPKFHRFTAPSYYGAPSIGAPPAGVVTFEGVDYDLFNVTTAGTGAGGSSFMDGYKTVGPNTGTYAVAFGEDASSSNANRGFRALAENTDVLDDLMHRDIALPLVSSTQTSDGTATYGSIVLPVDTFIGNSGGYALEDLFSIVDANDREIIDPVTYAKVTVTSISEAIGGGFSTGTLTLTFSQNVPNGVQFKVYYASRGNLATMPVDSLSYIRVRGAEEVSADVERLFAELHGNSLLWNDPWTSTIYDLARSGLNERYRRSTGSTGSLNTPGDGSTVVRDGQAVRVRTPNEAELGGVLSRTLYDRVNALVATEVDEVGLDGSFYMDETSIGSMGFVAYGRRLDVRNNFKFAPSIATFASLLPVEYLANPYGGAEHLYTNIPYNTTASIVAGGILGQFEITLSGLGTYPSAYWWKDVGAGVKKTAVVAQRDLVEVTVSGVTQTFVVHSLDGTDNKKVTVGCLDGGITALFGVATPCTVRWIRTQWYLGQGTPAAKASLDNFSAFDVTSLFEGMYLAFSPLRSSSTSTYSDDFFAPQSGFGNPLLSLGGDIPTRTLIDIGSFNEDPTVAKFESKGKVQANGTFSGVFRSRYASIGTTWDVVRDGDYVEIYNPASSSSTKLSVFMDNVPNMSVASAGYTGATYHLVVVRDDTTTYNQIEFGTISGSHRLSATDALLSPPITGQTVADVYTGKQFDDKIFWSVERYVY